MHYDINGVSDVARWIYYNPNPIRENAGDCVIRAICAVTGQDWNLTYTCVSLMGLVMGDMPSSNEIWREYLQVHGYNRRTVEPCDELIGNRGRAYLCNLGYEQERAPEGCYTVEDFADAHPTGKYVLGTGSHAVAVIDGEVWDAWDSRRLPIRYFYYKEDT